MKSPYNEMFDEHGAPRPHYGTFHTWLGNQSPALMSLKRAEADLIFRRVGITFAVYGDDLGAERTIPFDQVPRIFTAKEWADLESGLRQRVTALNHFIHDVYHDEAIIKAGIIPAEQIFNNAQYRPEMRHVEVPRNIYAQIAGIDIVRAGEGEFYVLEDNLRVPSGVSYMVEDRKMMMRLFPDLFQRYRVAPVEHYPDLLLECLKSVKPEGIKKPNVVVLTPGMFNSAYFEHTYLAQQMGVELVEGKDLFVKDEEVFMRTTRGPERVDVIYRRIDDDFLDPLAFRSDSALGVAGLLNAYRAGNITLANAIGTGIADDKSIYPYVPDMIEFYLGEKPILNNVPTYQCRKAEDLAYTLANIERLVVKETHGAGGYGMLVGPASTKAEIAQFKEILIKHPDQYIAQPTLALSTCPTFVDSGIAPRHIDLRPFVLSGKTIKMVPGGLTRVALKEGSLVVNSSQGGGTKDTWVLEDWIESAMLSRTADCLYWMARYTERAENTARMLDVNYQTSLLPQPAEYRDQSWRKLLTISKLESMFLERSSAMNRENILRFMIEDANNPSSIVSCLRAARENARAIRGRITSELWQTQNTTWLEFQNLLAKQDYADPSELLDWVKYRCHLFRGVMHGTMLKNEAYYFMRIGTLLERADNTARILETKYQDPDSLMQLNPKNKIGEESDSAFFDFYHWAALLRSVSAFEIYRQIYSDQITPQKTAELLIFNRQMPRSLTYCVNDIITLLGEIRNQNSKEIERLIGKLQADLDYSDIDEVFNIGLEEFTKQFLERINHIGDELSNAYLIPLAVA